MREKENREGGKARRRPWALPLPGLWLVGALAVSTTPCAQEVLISELLAANDSGLKDADGEASDWIEVWNAGAASVDLGGWSLTDDANVPAKWMFPAVVLGPNAFLVVFASGKDRALPGAELHTSFKLSSEPDYLALVQPGGAVAHEYAPAYPAQHEDVSYGLADGAGVLPLLALGAASRVHVPTHAADGMDWTSPSFDDAGWTAAQTGIGYEAGTGEPPPPGLPPEPPPDPPADGSNLALNAAASQSSDYGGFPADRAVDGDLGNFTATAPADPSPAWEVDLGRAFPLARIVLRNRGDGCCPSRLRDIRVTVLDGEGEAAFTSELLNPENVLGGGGTGGPAELVVDLLAAGGAVAGRHVRVERTPDPDLSGTAGAGGADEVAILSLGEVEVFAARSLYAEWIRTDVLAAMRGVNATAYLRVPFDVASTGAFERLFLRLRYDDGFVAYLNGVEVARRNALGIAAQAPGWNAAAVAERPGEAGVAPEEIDITVHLAALVAARNVLAVHGLNASASDPDFLLAPELEAAGRPGRSLRYFQKPTPGAANDPGGFIDFVEDTKFSVTRGFFEAAVDVELSTATPGAEIRYTLDRSAPTATSGLVYNGPLTIAATTVLRAAAFKPQHSPTNVDTQTYIFLDDVLEQPVMLKDIIASPVYGPELRASLLSVPTVSIVARSTIQGQSEVPASVELINPDGTPGFQIDAGIKKVGGHTLVSYPKNNMRLYFRKLYGQGKLKHALFKGRPYGDRAVESFDRLNLRSGAHDSVFYLGDGQQAPADAQYLRNRWINDMQFQMGQPSINGRFVQLYLNGTYWGFYDLMEWSSPEYFSSYFGGLDSDYAATNSGRPVGDSNIGAWNRILGLTGNYKELQRYLDLPNFADYLVLNFYGGNAWDWNPNQNWMAGGPVAPDRGGFKFICWDSDIIFRRTNDYNLDRGGPSNLYAGLKANPEFRVLLGDRAHKHLFNDGVLTPNNVKASYSRRAEEIRTSLVAETARWRWGNRVWTRDNQWQRELDRLRTDFFPRRPGILLDQLRQAGLYPRLEAPTLSRHGGVVPRGFNVSVLAPVGTVYFTTDGTDPRLPGGALSPAAREVGAASTETLIPAGAPARAFVPADGSLGADWTRIDFDDSSWKGGTTGVGFEKATGYEALIGIDVGQDAFERSATAYVRIQFEVADPAAWKALVLRVKYDDGFVAYLNGERLAAANAPAAPAWDSTATASRADNLALEFQGFDVTAAVGRLRAGKNLLALHALNLSASSNDFLILPELAGSTAGGGSLTIDGPTVVKARATSEAQWSALTEAFFWHDLPLRVTEILYHPRPWDRPLPIDVDEFELIELMNFGAEPLDLDGIRLEGGIAFDFSQGAVRTLRPGGVVLVVKSFGAFDERYDVAGLEIAGEYSGKLGNDGDYLRLVGPAGEPILDFAYSDAWYPRTDGEGYSLVLAMADPAADAWGDAATWTASERIDGSPGVVEERPDPDSFQLPGDATQDAKVDISDAVSLLGHLFLGSPSVLPCGDGSTFDGANLRLLDSTGDGGVDLTDAVRVLNYLFFGGSPPVLGTTCVPIPGCGSVCLP